MCAGNPERVSCTFINVYLLIGDAIAQGQETVGEMDVFKLHTGDSGIELHVRDVPETSHAHFHQPIGQLLRHILGNAEDGDIRGTLFCKDLCHLFAVIDLRAVDFCAHKAGVNVKGAVHSKAAGIEIEVIQAHIEMKTNKELLEVWSVDSDGFYCGRIDSEIVDGVLKFDIGYEFATQYYLIIEP